MNRRLSGNRLLEIWHVAGDCGAVAAGGGGGLCGGGPRAKKQCGARCSKGTRSMNIVQTTRGAHQQHALDDDSLVEE